jgi:hypothetical protein
VQLGLTSIVMTMALFPVADWALPPKMSMPGTNSTPETRDEMSGSIRASIRCECLAFLTRLLAVGIDGVTPFECYLCVAAGLWGGCLIGFITEYYTSHTYLPVREVARSTETGAATNIIYGLALGYQSCILPVIIISLIIFLSLRSDIHPHPIHQSLHAPFHPPIYQFINQSTIQLT